MLLPLTGGLFALGLLGAIGAEGVERFSSMLKRLFVFATGLASTLLLGALAVQTTLSRATDSAALRTASFAVSGMIPIVGNTVSGALSTLAAGLSYARGAVGAGAALAVVTLVAAPLLKLLAFRLTLDVCSSLLTLFGAKRSAAGLGGFRHALDVLIATAAMSSIVCILEILCLLKSGVLPG